ncbi:MAG: hypothetical protein Q8P51_14425 [Ignavibacteria bacterium]|nr:hypothetical protein [Ignavibacteria bacterium]
MANVRRDRFLRIAESRTNKILKMIKLLGNCSNRAVYEYESEEIRKVFQAIDRELKLARARFDEKDSDKFSLR